MGGCLREEVGEGREVKRGMGVGNKINNFFYGSENMNNNKIKE